MRGIYRPNEKAHHLVISKKLARPSVNLRKICRFESAKLREGARQEILDARSEDTKLFHKLIIPLIQEGQLSVSGERMCTILVNRLED